MINNLTNKVLLLTMLFFLAPYGFGIKIPGLQSLDFPKLIPFVLFLIVIKKFNFLKIDKSILILLVLIFFHFLSIFYSSNYQLSLIDFSAQLILYYTAFFIPFLFINSHDLLKQFLIKINYIFISYVLLSIFEFIFQINIFDFIRNTYTEDSRFNNLLGTIRLGFKASMGPYASTIPFAYAFATIFFLRDVYKPNFLNKKLIQVTLICLGLIGIVFTLSRAAILIVIVMLFFKYLFKSNLKAKISFITISALISIIMYSKIKQTPYETYIENYIVNIFNSENEGANSRLNNNVIDFNAALKKPILGHGAGLLHYYKTSKANYSERLDSSDSSFLLTIFFERGFVSLLTFCILIFISFKRCIFLSKIKSNDFKLRSLFYSFLVILVCLNSSQRSEVYFLFFLILGLINSVYLIYKNHVNFNHNSNL